MPQNKMMERTHALTDEVLNQLKAMDLPVNQETEEMVRNTVFNLFEKGILPKETLSFSPLVMEKIYFHAYNLFQAGKYKNALILFDLLFDLDSTDTRYSFAAGACQHYLKNYLKAAARYIECTMLDPRNPVPYFHLYDCFMNTGHLVSAYAVIHQLMEVIGNRSEYQTLKDKAQLEMNFLEGHLKKELKEKYGEMK